MVTDKNQSLKLVLVSKGRSAQEVQKVLASTQISRIAENRIEEAEDKFELLKGLGFSFEKHFIGKLQSRKIRKVVDLFDVIQSVESLEQAEKISRCAQEQGKNMDLFLEVNLSGLPQRSGAKAEEVPALIPAIRTLPHVRVQGVMGMASLAPEETRAQFKLLKSLQGDLPECSMGMSSDYPIAIEEGSTMLRLGRSIFEQGLPKGVLFE